MAETVNTIVGSNLKVPKVTKQSLKLAELSQDQSTDSQPSFAEMFPMNPDQTAPVANAASSVNMAAHAAFLGTDSADADAMISSYRQALTEDTLEGQSSTATALFNQAKAGVMQNASKDLIDVLADPNLTDDQKRAAANAAYDRNSVLYNSQNMVSTKALSQPSGSLDNAETDNTRFSIAKTTQDMNATKKQIQDIYNSALSKTQPNLARKTASFLLGLVPFSGRREAAAVANDFNGAGAWATIKTFMGWGKSDFIKQSIAHLNSLPPDQQVQAAQKLADIINEHSNIVFIPDDSTRRELLQDMLGGQGYTFQRVFGDNLGTIMDDLVFADGMGAIGKAGKAAKAARAAEVDETIKGWDVGARADWTKGWESNYREAQAARTPQFARPAIEGPSKPIQPVPPASKEEGIIRAAKQDAVRSNVQPVSIYENLKDTNPDMARDAFDSITIDESGEAAQALAGTDRDDAIFAGMGPEMAHADGSIKAKILSPDAMAQLRESVPFDVTDITDHDGKTQYLQKEKAAAQAWKVNQFESAIGFTPRGEMFTIRPDLNNFVYTPHGVAITGVYGPANNGFSDAWDAVDVAKFALRNTGIDEEDIGLLRREGGRYVPTTLDELPALKEKASVWAHATVHTGPIEAGAVTKKGLRFDLVDKPTTMDTSSYGLKGDQWIREVIAKDKDTGEQIGRLIYTNYDRPPSIRVNREYQRQGVATAMLKLAKNQGGVLGDDVTGEFANGAKSTRTEEGQAFRANNKPESVNVFLKDNPLVDDYLISVNHDAHITADDVNKSMEMDEQSIRDPGWQPLKVKLNFFDRYIPLGGRQGTISGLLFDKASMLDPVIVQPAVQAADKSTAIEKSLLGMVSDFTDQFKALPKWEQHLVNNEILDSNLMRRESNYTRLMASGMSQNGVNVIKAFRKYWNSDFVLRNKVYANHLKNQGWQEFVHSPTQTNFPVRPVSKASVSDGVRVYNPQTDTLDSLSKEDVDLLYKNGGGVAKLKQAFSMQGGNAEYVLYRNNPNEGYLREFNNNSQVLNYIPGYFKVAYKDPLHIVEVVKDANGKPLYEHSVTSAKDLKAARIAKSRLQAQNADNEYYIRKDKGLNLEGRLDNDFDLDMAAGRVAFRRRGKLLEDADSAITDLSKSHVRNPVETMVSSAISLSKKIALQDVLDAMGQRMLWQYRDRFPTNDFGQPYIPSNLSEIRYRGGGDQDDSITADARTAAGYYNYLKMGYVNILDDGIKATLQGMADIFGKVGLSPVERITRNIANKSLSRGLNSATYYAYLGTAPLRQALVQSNQALLLTALNPRWVASIKAYSQPMYIAMRTLGIEADHAVARGLAKSAWGDSRTAEKVFEQFRRSGLATAVDHQNMLSGAVNDMARNMIANAKDTALSAVTKPLHSTATILRKVGFDAGEFYNMLMSWLAHRDLAERAGKDVFSDDVADQIVGQARNYTGNMNFAGDLDSNRNALNLIFKYTQNSQKMFLNCLTNRGIPPWLKAKMAVANLLIWGVGSTLFFSIPYLASIKNRDVREGVRQGVFGLMVNKMMTLMTGHRSEIDWSTLSPINARGAMELIHSLVTTDLGQIIANTPSLSLVFGKNPRVAKAFKDLARWTHLIDDYQDKTTFLQVASDFAKISSGYSALSNAIYILEAKKKVNSSGSVTQDDIDKINAIGVAMGFGTIHDAEAFYVNHAISIKRQDIINDTTNYYNSLKQHYLDKRLEGNELAYTQGMLNEAWRMPFMHTDLGRQTFNKLLEKDLESGDGRLYNNILANCDLFKHGDCINLIKDAPFEDEKDRQNMLDLVKWVQSYDEPDYDEKR